MARTSILLLVFCLLASCVFAEDAGWRGDDEDDEGLAYSLQGTIGAWELNNGEPSLEDPTYCDRYCYVRDTTPRGLSVSGLSGGGFAAVQFHISFSEDVIGAGIMAAGPYYCSQGNLGIALTTCMLQPGYISLDTLYGETYFAEFLGTIDRTSNLKDDKVWLFSGTLDSVVLQGSVAALGNYYRNYIEDDDNVVEVFDVEAEHSIVTNSFGSACDLLSFPFINNCGVDSAGELLNHIYGELEQPVEAIQANILEIDQNAFIPGGVDPSFVSLGEKAYAYVPTNCRDRSSRCDVHVAFHGCAQGSEFLGLTYVTQTGYNGWAEANDIIVLYPQVASNPVNPQGCFDWWGYTGPAFATKYGIQMATVKHMTDFFASDGTSLIGQWSEDSTNSPSTCRRLGGRRSYYYKRLRYLQEASLAARWLY